ncbi:tannase and feruloyl esterase [Colletotrichum somersetense]|nr:tannase and feruloyl esterase [Colletotrichum somersetense]
MAVSLEQSCVSSVFSPSVFGGPAFCNVTITYTHPGHHDSTIVETWLPLAWNERLMGVGGSGYAAGRVDYSYMYGGVAQGYATVTTDAGLGSAQEPSPWALDSPGNVNLYNLQNLGFVSLNESAMIGKSLIKSFYEQEPTYSYWIGCSQGGRQGLMLAQRYPEVYDGIVAGAPAISHLVTSNTLWPQQIMNELGEYPYPCEFDAIVEAAVSACDGLDGVVDGVISDADACLGAFDPFSVVGTSTACAQADGADKIITEAAATVVNATWRGMVTADGETRLPGLLPGVDLSGNLLGLGGIAATTCGEDACAGAPSFLGSTWVRFFLARNVAFDLANLTRKEFDTLVHAGDYFSSLLDAVDPDLRAFKAAGGKMVSYHCLAGGTVPPGATENYYKAVSDISPDLRVWVENGTTPEYTPISVTVGNATHDRILCPYPQRAAYRRDCGDASKVKCWYCSSGSTVSRSGK